MYRGNSLTKRMSQEQVEWKPITSQSTDGYSSPHTPSSSYSSNVRKLKRQVMPTVELYISSTSKRLSMEELLTLYQAKNPVTKNVHLPLAHL